MSDDRPKAGALPAVSRKLAHGRSLEWAPAQAGRGDTLAIRDADGRLEVTITLDAAGPVVKVRGARLEIATPEELALECRTLSLNTREGLSLNAGGDFRLRSGAEIEMKSQKSAWIDADWVNLNCLDRTGYHDEHLVQQEGADAAAGEDAGEESGGTGP